MHPPFGFALFYLRSVAPAKDYVDRLSKKLTKGVTTGQIYWGAVPFVMIQIVMIGLVITFPQMVMVYKAGEKKIDINTIHIVVPEEQSSGRGAGKGTRGGTPGNTEQEDAEKALERAFGGQGGGGTAPAEDGTAATPGDGKPPAAPEPGAAEQDDAQKALERALGNHGPGAASK
jgi:hypothetical protein